MKNLSEELKKIYKDENLFLSDDKCRLYDKNKEKRYYYYDTVKDSGNKKATVIMINPSENLKPDSNTPDKTINNLKEILNTETDISEFEVLNLYSLKAVKPEDVLNKKLETLNKDIIKYVIKKADLIVPAWGIDEKFNNETKAFIEDIKELCKGKTVKIVINNYPCHFSPVCTSKGRHAKLTDYYFTK